MIDFHSLAQDAIGLALIRHLHELRFMRKAALPITTNRRLNSIVETSFFDRVRQ